MVIKYDHSYGSTNTLNFKKLPTIIEIKKAITTTNIIKMYVKQFVIQTYYFSELRSLGF